MASSKNRETDSAPGNAGGETESARLPRERPMATAT